MKKFIQTLGVLTIFLAFYNTTKAQENVYFQNNPLWKITANCSFGGYCIKNEFYNYYTQGDTTIDSINYVQIYKRAQGTLTWNSTGPNFGCEGSFVNFETQPTCFLRSLDKQMFIRMPGDTIEMLLYDFNLEVGDTLPVTYNCYFPSITVAAIDSIYTPNGFKKRFTLAGNTWSQYLLEGIGHSRGLIEPLVSPFDCTYSLNCYGYNDSSYYPNTNLSCDAAIGIIEKTGLIETRIYPNPFSDFTTFYFDKTLKNVELSLFSVLGEKIKTLKSNTENELILNRDGLFAGAYFYELKQGGRIISNGKVMIKN